jgi:Ca2+-transporting ATPase
MHMLLLGLVMAAGTLATFAAARSYVEEDRASTLAFTTFVLFQLVNALNVRSEHISVFSLDVPQNRWLAVSLGTVLAAQVCVVYVPALQAAFGTSALTLVDWTAAAIVALLALVTAEAAKSCSRDDRHSAHRTARIPAGAQRPSPVHGVGKTRRN